MLEGEDIRKLSDVDLELYMLGVEEMERERNKLLKDKFTKEELLLIENSLNGFKLHSFYSVSIQQLQEKVGDMWKKDC